MVVMLYACVLFAANLVGDHSLQIFYFTFSTGTLFIQLVFCCIIGLSETIGFRKTNRIVWLTGAINFLIALFVYYGLNYPVPDFWSKSEVDAASGLWQFGVILMFTISYIVTGLVMIKTAAILRVLLGKDWLSLRVMLTVVMGLIIDMLLLSPVLYSLGPDRYMAVWKMLSLITVRIWLSVFAIPFSYLLVLLLKNRRFFMPFSQTE